MSERRKREDGDAAKREDGNAARGPSRRRFTKTLAAAVVAAPVLVARAQTPPASKEPKAPPGPQPTPQEPPKPSPVAAAYLEVARARFGEQLSAEQFEAVRRGLEGNVRTADRLRSFKLKNSDEPDFVFSA